MSSPGVSTKNCTDSNTPERTGPYGRVKTPSPARWAGSGVSSRTMGRTCPETGRPGLGGACPGLRGNTRESMRGWPSGARPKRSASSRSYQAAPGTAGVSASYLPGPPSGLGLTTELTISNPR